MRIKNYVKIPIILLLIINTLIIITGCETKEVHNIDSNNNNNNNISNQISLRFISSWGGFDTKAEILEKTLNNFMQDNPNISIINESMAGSDFLFRIKKDFASGNDPDIFCLWPGSDIKALIKAGKVADLTEVYEKDEEWKNSFHSVEWTPIMHENRIYGLPVEVIFEGLFCNVDLFEKYDIKIPTDYNELKEAIIKFKEVGIIPIAFNTDAEGSYLYQNIIAYLGQKEEIEVPINNDIVSQCYIDAMKYVKELYNLGAFPEDAFFLTNNDRDYLFIKKNAAMIVQGSWFIGNFDVNDTTVDIVPFPKIKDDNEYPTVIYGLGAGIFYMSTNAWENPKKQNACISFMKYMTGSEAILEFTKETGMLSNVDIDRSKIGKYNIMVERGISIVNDAIKTTSPPDHFVNRTVWDDIIVKNFPYYLENRITANDIWYEAVKRNNEIYGN